MSLAGSEHQLLLGLLAFQNGMIDRAGLLSAFDAWSQGESASLGEILVRQKSVSGEERVLIEALVERYVVRHGGDVEKSLAHVGKLNPTVQDELARIADPDVRDSLAIVGRDADPFATMAFGAGKPVEGGRFRVLRPHARGGVGEVFVASDAEIPREVALKQIQERHADHAEARARFVQEAEITGALEHPGIVPVYGLGTYADGRPFYAMRFINGDSLQQAIRRFYDAPSPGGGSRTVEFRNLLKRFIDVCYAVDYAHSRGVLHRDLKPGNIMLGKYGETLVVDWGLAKAVGKPETPHSTIGAERTVQLSGTTAGGSGTPTEYGSAVGTPAYMSPEQAAGRLDDLGTASDIYGLGATLYQILSGKAPYEGTLDEVLRKVQRGEFSRPRLVNSRLPSALEAICLKAMALRPADRYTDARELADDVERWLADETVTAYREPVPARLARLLRKHRALAATLLAAIAVAATASGFGSVLLYREQKRTEQQRNVALDLAEHNAELARREKQQRTSLQRQTLGLQIDQAVALSQSNMTTGSVVLGECLRAAETAGFEELEHEVRLQLSGVMPQLHSIRWMSDLKNPLIAPRGRRLVAQVGESEAIVVDWTKGSAAEKIGERKFSARRLLGISPDGRRVAIIDSRDQFAVVDLDIVGRVVAVWPDAQPTMIVGFQFDHSGERGFVSRNERDGTRTGTVVRLAGAGHATTVETVGESVGLVASGDAARWVRFSLDGATVHLLDDQHRLIRVDSETGEVRNLSVKTVSDSEAFEVGPSENVFFLSATNRLVRRWEAADQLNRVTIFDKGYIQHLRYAPAAETLWVGANNFGIAKVDLVAKKWNTVSSGVTPRSLAVSPDGSRVAYSDDRFEIHVLDAKTGKLLGAPIHTGKPVQFLDFDGGDGLIFNTYDRQFLARLENADRGAKYRRFASGQPYGVCWGDRGRLFVSFRASPETATSWGPIDIASIDTDPKWFSAPAEQPFLSANADLTRVVTFGNGAQLRDAATGESIGPERASSVSGPRTVAMSPRFPCYATFDGASKKLGIWGTVDGNLLGEHTTIGFEFNGLAWSTTKDRVFALDSLRRKLIQVEAASTKPQFVERNLEAACKFLACSADGARVVVTSGSDFVYVYDVESWTKIAAVPQSTSIEIVALSPDGRWLAVGGRDGIIRLSNLETNSAYPPFQNGGVVTDIAFSSDSRFMAGCSSLGVGRLWYVPSGRRIGPVLQPGPPTSFAFAKFAPDDSAVAVRANSYLMTYPLPKALVGDASTLASEIGRKVALIRDETGGVRVRTPAEWKAVAHPHKP
jgi:WD40 repeat protein/tRNA A-37 threonylcarbamoyl transferase component Bud32